MSLKIQNSLQKRIIGFNVEKKVKKLLRVIPEEHLIGLDEIVIVDEIKSNKKAGGLYRTKYNRQPCLVEISIDTIYRGMPKILFLLPFVADFTLADALYHEIGHHYHQRFSHRISKNMRESFAESYSKKMLKKAFCWWLIFLLPLSPLVRYLNKLVNRGKA